MKYHPRPPRHRTSRKDPVHPETRIAVFVRDQGCVAPRLGAQTPCGGRLMLDHVHAHSGGTKGKRAPSDAAHMATVCESHSENGARAGHVWNLANREALRSYLLTAPVGPGGEE